ncbi:MAG: chemotaxis protein CheW [Nitrospirota bacterium]
MMNANKKNQVVSFKIGRELFGVYIHMVQEIVRVPEITPVPEMPIFVEGVINLRGKIVSIVDLNKRLKIGESVKSRSNRVLIVEVEKKVIGLLVDAVTEILRIPPEAIEPAPDIATAVGTEYIMGVGKMPDKLIILLDLKNILNPEEIRKLSTDERAGSGKGNHLEAAA